MGMTLTEALTLTRNIIRDELGLTITDDDVNFTTESLTVYLRMSLTYAAKKEIEADPNRRRTIADLNGNDTEFINNPTDFMKWAEIRVDEDSEMGCSLYEKITPEVRSNWTFHTKTGYAYYPTGTQVALLPYLATGEKAIGVYYKTPTLWTDTDPTDITDEACMVACLKAALYALSARGDNNLMAIRERLKEAEDDLYMIRQEDDMAEVVDEDLTGTARVGVPINITITTP